MKNIYLLLFGLVIFLAGCSSTYVLKNYPSPRKYFKKLNNLSKGKNIKIKFNNGTAISYSKGVKINEDSLFLKDYYPKTDNLSLHLNIVNNIEYQGTSNSFSSGIILINGIHYTAKNIKIKNDSIHFVNLYKINKAIPNWRITGISFNNRLLGMYYGVALGTAAGILSTWLGILPSYKYTHYGNNYFNKKIAPSLLKLIPLPVIGAVLGYIIGYHYTFLLNP